MNGYDSSEMPEFRDAMAVLDVSRDDLKSLFNILDEDYSGDVSYAEFVEQLYKMKSQDTQVMLVFIKSHLKEVQQRTEDRFETLQQAIAGQESNIRAIMEKLGCQNANGHSD